MGASVHRGVVRAGRLALVPRTARSDCVHRLSRPSIPRRS